MNALEYKEKVEAVKNELRGVLVKWSYNRIDDFANGNPVLLAIGNRLKKRIDNEVNFKSDQLDKYMDEASMWIVDDKEGNVSIGSAVDDVIAVLDGIPETPFKMGFLEGTFGDGKVSLLIPGGVITSAILGKNNCITLKHDDFMALKEMIMKNNLSK